MKNIFENAYFGKPYKTKNGKRAILEALYTNAAYLIVEDPINRNLFGNKVHAYRLDGICKDFPKLDIVSEWYGKCENTEDIEPIYFELAENLTETLLLAVGRKDIDGHTATALWIKNNMPHCKEPIDEEELDKLALKEYPDDDDDDTPLNGIDNYEYREAFKAGYRKAMEE